MTASQDPATCSANSAAGRQAADQHAPFGIHKFIRLLPLHAGAQRNCCNVNRMILWALFEKIELQLPLFVNFRWRAAGSLEGIMKGYILHVMKPYHE